MLRLVNNIKLVELKFESLSISSKLTNFFVFYIQKIYLFTVHMYNVLLYT